MPDYIKACSVFGIREKKKLGFKMGFSPTIKARVLEGFSWVISRVGVTMVTPYNHYH
jgi:hypothetical protein